MLSTSVSKTLSRISPSSGGSFSKLSSEISYVLVRHTRAQIANLHQDVESCVQESSVGETQCETITPSSHTLQGHHSTTHSNNATNRTDSYQDRCSEQATNFDDGCSDVETKGGGGGNSNGETKRKVSLSLPTVFVPEKLETALQKALAGHPHKALALDGQSLTKFLVSRKVQTKLEIDKKKKKETTTSNISPWENDKNQKKSKSFHMHFKYGKREAVAFAAGRLQSSYGTTLRVLTEVARGDPTFRPETLLDFGSGLGTTVWAAHQLWAESVYEYQCVDVSREMGDFARVLRGGESPQSEPHPLTSLSGDGEVIPGVHFRQYLPLSNKVQYDVVVSAQTLGEIPSVKLRRMFIAALWRKTKSYIVLIEPGNWTGFNVISEARDMILQASQTWTKYEDETSQELTGHVVAPCPHDLACPLVKGDSKLPCYFGQRVQLAFSERSGPLKHKGFRLENFSYVVLKKGQRRKSDGPDARILQPTKKRTRHILCKLCTREGEAKEVILTKSKHRELYKECRQSKWGDTLNKTSQHFTNSHNTCTSY